MKKSRFILAVMIVVIQAVAFISCGGDDDDPELVLTPSDVSVYYDGTQQLTCSEKVDSWLSEDEFIAEVSSSGLVKGCHVGTTRIKAVQGNKVAYSNITIVPQYNLFDAPITDFEATKTTIKNKENHQLYSETDNELNYTFAEGNHPCLATYKFENGKLKAIMLLLKYSDYLTAGYHLVERYQPLTTTDDLIVFVDGYKKETLTMAITLGSEKIGSTRVTGVMYTPWSSISSSNVRTRGLTIDEQLLQKFLSEK